MRRTLSLLATFLVATCARGALADEPAPPPVDEPPVEPAGTTPDSPPPVPVTPPATAPVPAPPSAVVPVGRTPFFRVDPVADSILIAVALGFSQLNDVILSTGEIRPQRPGDPKNLIALDRVAVKQTFDSNMSTYSSVGLFVALGYAALDPVISWARLGKEAALVDAVLYGESITLAMAFTGLTKIAVRRPRPSAYKEQAELDKEFGPDKSPSITDTNSSLSFFSGHAALVSSVSATATYLAFARSPGTARPWVTLALGLALTGSVSFARVRAGAHFPTDVMAGALAGAGIGVLVPHFHRFYPTENGRSLWMAMGHAGTPAGLTLNATF
jgi:undecaprenyl-diphosphatase